MTAKQYHKMIAELGDEIRELKGSYREVAIRAKVNISTVYRVFDGVLDNDKVVNTAIEYRDELRIKNEQRLVKLSKAIGS